jgi:hypothetical protein
VGALTGHALGRAEAMWHDELNAPLGQDPVRERQSRGKTIVLAGFLGGGILAGAFAPFGHSVLEQTRPPAPAFDGADFSRPAQAISAMPAAGPGQPDAATPGLFVSPEESETTPPLRLPNGVTCAGRAETAAESIDAQSGVKIVRAGGAAAPGALIIDVAKALRAQAAAAGDSGMIEQPLGAPRPRIRRAAAQP